MMLTTTNHGLGTAPICTTPGGCFGSEQMRRESIESKRRLDAEIKQARAGAGFKLGMAERGVEPIRLSNATGMIKLVAIGGAVLLFLAALMGTRN